MSTVSVSDNHALAPRSHSHVCLRQSQNGASMEDFPSFEFRSPTCRTCVWRSPRASDPSATLAVFSTEEPLRSLRASSARAPFLAPAQTLSPRSEGRGRRRRERRERSPNCNGLSSTLMRTRKSLLPQSLLWSGGRRRREITAYSRALQWMSSCTARFSLFLPPPLFHQPQKTSGVLEGHTDDGRRRYESGSKGGMEVAGRWKAVQMKIEPRAEKGTQ